MDQHLDQLFLEFPHPNTLARLIYDSAAKFGHRIWVNTKTGAITYKTADTLSLEIASFLKENRHPQKSYLFIADDKSAESSVVLLGAIKAGVTLVDARVYPPLAKQNFIDNKQLLVFENQRFNDGKNEIDYRRAIKRGEMALFFNIPPIDETHNAFYFFTRDESNSLQTYPVAHKRAVKQIFSSATGQNLHPYIHIVYNWFNGFEAMYDV
jgi:hypothetical protein